MGICFSYGNKLIQRTVNRLNNISNLAIIGSGTMGIGIGIDLGANIIVHSTAGAWDNSELWATKDFTTPALGVRLPTSLNFRRTHRRATTKSRNSPEAWLTRRIPRLNRLS